jgi:hypothetical protein
MTADQINELRDNFRVALLDWDVPVSVTIEDDYAIVRFTLWGTKIEGWFQRHKNQWITNPDCPHAITGSTSVWQWIATHLHERLPAPK